MRLSGASVTSTEVIKAWKENFPMFWPKWDHFYKPVTGIAPGEAVLINMLIPLPYPFQEVETNIQQFIEDV